MLQKMKIKHVQNTFYKNRTLEVKISQEKVEILEYIKKFNNQHDICCVLTLYYILECVELNDWNNIKHILPILRYPENNNNFEKLFLSQFITSLSEHVEYLKVDWISKLVFDDFLVKNIKLDISYELVYKLMDKLFNYLSHETYFHLLDELKPKKTVSLDIFHIFFGDNLVFLLF